LLEVSWYTFRTVLQETDLSFGFRHFDWCEEQKSPQRHTIQNSKTYPCQATLATNVVMVDLVLSGRLAVCKFACLKTSKCSVLANVEAKFLQDSAKNLYMCINLH
jgi:hypothetical protein